MTSHTAVMRVRRKAKVKVGHTGTLDPAATGVLILCLGKATRLSRFFTDYPKEYIANLHLGVVTDTDDAEGEVIGVRECGHFEIAEVQSVLDRFVGEIDQIPPRYSAIHHQGKRLYELARAGINVEAQPRRVVIEEIRVIGWSLPYVTFRIRCSKGTYIRSLCRDVGETLNVGGHLSSLVRTRVGHYQKAAATPLSSLSSKDAVERAIIPLKDLLPQFPELRVDKDDIIPLLCGQALTPANLVGLKNPLEENQRYRLFDAEGELLALAQARTLDEGILVLKPERVFK